MKISSFHPSANMSTEAELAKDPRCWGTRMSDFRVGSHIRNRYVPRKPGPQNPHEHRRKQRLAKGLDEFSRFVEIVAADVQESAPELRQDKWPDPAEDDLDHTEEEGADLGPDVNCMTFTKNQAQTLIDEMCAACGDVPAVESGTEQSAAYPMVVEMKHDVRRDHFSCREPPKEHSAP